jgi:hypothetical protein
MFGLQDVLRAVFEHVRKELSTGGSFALATDNSIRVEIGYIEGRVDGL